MIIGIDFDNTIVCYDRIFHAEARRRGLIDGGVAETKGAVRDYLRAENREDDWTELQGYVYGPGIDGATPFAGVTGFFEKCKSAGHEVYIISHKTKHPVIGPRHDLHDYAMQWLISNHFLDQSVAGLAPENVFFELTREDKLERIASTGCTHFVDDLPEFLGEPGFPGGVVKVLFDPNAAYEEKSGVMHCTSWREITEEILGKGSALDR